MFWKKREPEPLPPPPYKITPEGPFYIHLSDAIVTCDAAKELAVIQDRLGSDWKLVSNAPRQSYWVSTWERISTK